jgi:phosphoglycolate phosphatase
MFKNVKTVFFDFDGTLHDSSKIYGPAFRKAYTYLVDAGFAEQRDWTDEEVSHWLGYTSLEMWEKFMPQLDEEIRLKASKIIGKAMHEALDQGQAFLYEGVLEVLAYLKKKDYTLVFLSNCGTRYKDHVKNAFELNKYFTDMICAEAYNFIPKYKIMEQIKGKYQQDLIMVGDRIHDIETGRKNNIYTIGCTYGYGSKGEMEQADVVINHIKEIVNFL